jgi:hypothetical protein
MLQVQRPLVLGTCSGDLSALVCAVFGQATNARMTTKALVCALKVSTTTACCRAQAPCVARHSCVAAAVVGQPCGIRHSFTTTKPLVAQLAAFRRAVMRWRARLVLAGRAAKATARHACCEVRCVLTRGATARVAYRRCSSLTMARMWWCPAPQVRGQNAQGFDGTAA